MTYYIDHSAPETSSLSEGQREKPPLSFGQRGAFPRVRPNNYASLMRLPICKFFRVVILRQCASKYCTAPYSRDLFYCPEHFHVYPNNNYQYSERISIRQRFRDLNRTQDHDTTPLIDKYQSEEEQRFLDRGTSEEERLVCPICMDRDRNIALNCAHTLCDTCALNLIDCPMCRTPITNYNKIII